MVVVPNGVASARVKHILILVALFLLQIDCAHAQSGGIDGELVMPAGAGPCVRCPVQLEDQSGPGSRNAVTDVQGKFYFSDLPGGPYTLRVRATGFRDAAQFVMVNTGTSTRVSIELESRDKEPAKPNNASETVDRSTFLGGYPKLAIELYEKATDRIRKNRSDDALKFFEEALAIAPDFYPAHAELGVAYLSLGRYGDAERELQTAARINQTSVDPMIQLGNTYLLRRDWPQAAQASMDALRRDSRSAGAYFNLGLALYCDAKFDLSENALRAAVRLDPSRNEIHLLLVSIDLRLSRWDEAMNEIDQSLKTIKNDEVKTRLSELRSRLRRGEKSGAGFTLEFPVRVGPTMRPSPCG